MRHLGVIAVVVKSDKKKRHMLDILTCFAMYCSHWVNPPNLCRPLVMFDHLNTLYETCFNFAIHDFVLVLPLSFPLRLYLCEDLQPSPAPVDFQAPGFWSAPSSTHPLPHLQVAWGKAQFSHYFTQFVSMTWKYICINLTDRWWKESQQYTWDKPICQFYSIWLIYIGTFLWQSCGWSAVQFVPERMYFVLLLLLSIISTFQLFLALFQLRPQLGFILSTKLIFMPIIITSVVSLRKIEVSDQQR